MTHGGIIKNQRAEQIVRFSALLVPVVLMLYGFMIQYGMVNASSYISDSLFFVVMSSWVLAGSLQFLYPPKNTAGAVLRVGSYHIFAAIYLIFISGFSMPFTVCWVLLFLATYFFFSDNGLRISIVVFIATAAADTIIHASDTERILNNTFYLLAVLIVGLTATFITRVHQTDQHALDETKKEGDLQRDSILTLINNLAEAVISTDQQGRIRVYNAAVLGLLDTNDNIGGRHIDDIVKLYDEQGSIIRLTKLLKQARSVNRDDTMTMMSADEEMRVEVTYSPIRTDAQGVAAQGYIIILRDITKTKSLEEERDEFISVVSHELRTPITVAEGSLSNARLLLDRNDVHNNILKDGLKAAHEQIIFLSRMVNDLSTLSRAERGIADEVEVIDIKELVHTLHSEYSPEAKKKGLVFNLDTHGKLGAVSTSRLYLHELLQNFITNAIKYTKTGSVTLHVTRKDGVIHFSVKDTGIGISKVDRVKIFDKFYRSEDYRTRETGGTGLGLYVSAKLAKKLGCKITLTSRLNHGSTFSFTLPEFTEK